MSVENPSENNESPSNGIKDVLIKIFPGLEDFLNMIFKSDEPEQTPEAQAIVNASRTGRAALAAEVVAASETLPESGEESKTNIMRIPSANLELTGWSESSQEPKNSWVEKGNEIFWCDHMGYLVSVPQVKWYLRQGFNADEHENLEEFMDGYVVQATFLGHEIIGGVIPELRDRLQEAERLMEERNISYGPNGIDTIHGYAYRAMGRDGTGMLSNHAMAALDFSKNRRNQLINIPGGNFEDYMDTVDYSEEFYSLMVNEPTIGFRGFRSWVANRGNGNRDTMQFDLVPNSDGILTNTGDMPEDYLA
jgi:hypothetical protein